MVSLLSFQLREEVQTSYLALSALCHQMRMRAKSRHNNNNKHSKSAGNSNTRKRRRNSSDSMLTTSDCSTCSNHEDDHLEVKVATDNDLYSPGKLTSVTSDLDRLLRDTFLEVGGKDNSNDSGRESASDEAMEAKLEAEMELHSAGEELERMRIRVRQAEAEAKRQEEEITELTSKVRGLLR